MNQDQAQDQDQAQSQQQEQELIRNVKDYDPSKPNNAQLADDMRIVFAWYSSLCEGKKLKFTKEEVINLARKIYQEIEKRKREGRMKHEWKPELMKPHSRELFKIIVASPHLSTALQSERESGASLMDFRVEFIEERRVGKFTSKIFRYVTPEGYPIDNAFYIRVEDQTGKLVHEVDQPPPQDIIFHELQSLIPTPPNAISELPVLISPKNPFWHFTTTPEEPVLCYQVFSTDDHLIHLIDAHTGKEIGTGTPPPFNSLVFAGSHEGSNIWRPWWRNAAAWFSAFGSPPFAVYQPQTSVYLDCLQSSAFGGFHFEFGHGDSICWYTGHEWVYTSSIAEKLEAREPDAPPLNFIYLGHCGALVDTGEGTFADVFSQGRSSGYVIIGFYNMHDQPTAWSHSQSWQNSLFTAIAAGHSAGDAFDIACAAFPDVTPAVRLHGDPDYVPIPSPDFTTLEGHVDIESQPSEASIFIDGTDTGMKTPASVPVPIPIEKIRTTHCVKVTLKHRFFYDKTRSAYIRPNFTYHLAVKMRPSVRIVPKTILHKYSVTFEFSLQSKVTGEVIREPLTFKLINLSTHKELTATTDDSGTATFSISFQSTFFVPGRQKLICTLEGSDGLIRTFRRITIRNRQWLSASASDPDADTTEDWHEPEPSELLDSDDDNDSEPELYIPFSTLPIYPGHASAEYEPIDLDTFLANWNSFFLRKPFIMLVGSLANWQHTTGDIDILVKARDPTPLLNALDRAINTCFERGDEQLADLLIQVRQFIHADSLFLLTRWRIERAFPEFKDRIHVLDDSFSGPFTNFVELSDLAAIARSEPIRQQMSTSDTGIKLFRWFPMLKPMHGRHKGEIYSIDSVIEVLKSRKEDWFDIGIYVQKKYDGTHCQVHKGGDKVFIYTEDGTDVTKNCPTLVQEFRQQPFHSFILCGEIELWKHGKHQPRAITAGILNANKPQPDEKHLRFNVYDCVFFEDVGDIHNRPYSERIKFYQKIHETEHIKLAPYMLCHAERCVRESIKKFAALEGSEGAYLKRADFPYELDGKTRLNLKFKKERSLDALVLKRKKVAGTEKTFYYICGLKGDSGIVYCGKTFNTNIKAEPGDIIKVVFVDISGYTDPKTKKRWVNWWAPRVVMLRSDKKEPDNIETAWRMVKQTTGRFEEKPMPDIEHLEELASADADARTRAKRFVIQNHFRGSSSHGDFRVQLNHVLGGFTLGWQRADELEKELDKHWELKKTADRYEIYWDGQLFYALDKRERVIKEPPVALKRKVFAFHKKLAFDPRYWKVDMQTGEELSREGSPGTAKRVEKIFCVQKTREPYEWLSMEGITKPREIEPEPGGTRFFPGIFVEVDSGTYYPGAQKPYFKEYFLNGKKWKGRVVFRLVAGLKGTKAVANWLYWKPDDQTPYVLSARAVRDNWLPAEGEGSAMPPEWERKLPEELHFWKASTRKQKLKLRKLAREYFKKKHVLSADANEVEFILTHRYWQGQFVVRGLPVEDYHLKIGEHRFHLDKDPTYKFPEQGISALQFRDKDEFFVEGRKKPQSPVNPNRKIPAFISVLDRGKAEIIADQPLYLHVRLNGKKLKGLFYFRRTSRASEFWTFKKGMETF